MYHVETQTPDFLKTMYRYFRVYIYVDNKMQQEVIRLSYDHRLYYFSSIHDRNLVKKRIIPLLPSYCLYKWRCARKETLEREKRAGSILVLFTIVLPFSLLSVGKLELL